jgi:Predicted ATPase with chaperone activity
VDRLDIHIEVSSVKYNELDTGSRGEPSSEIRKRVNKARKMQLERYYGLGIYSNSQLRPSMIEKYCSLNEQCRALLKNAFDRLGLSARAYTRILKVARTIADMDEAESIGVSHLAEAIQYRSLDRNFWQI